MKKQSVKVTVYEGAYYDDGFPSGALSGVIAWLQLKQLEIPEEYRTEAQFEISHEAIYDSCCANLEIFYWRLETDEEAATRIAKQEYAVSRRRAWLEDELRKLG